MIISIDAEKKIRQNSASIYDLKKKKKPLNKADIEGKCLNIVRATYNKPTVDIVLNF